MENKNEKQTFIIQIMLVIFFALLLAYPVTIYIKRANNPDAFVTEQQLKSFESDKFTLNTNRQNVAPLETEGGLNVGRQSTRYSNTGQAILSVNIYNLTKLSKDDFTKVGQTPWSLMNTVKGNLATPQVLDIVFNNEAVVEAFMTRPSTAELNSNYLKIYDMLMQNSYTVEKFLNNPTVEAALNDEAVLSVLSKSKLMTRILTSPTAQYFINNPQITKKLISNNPAFKNVLANEKLKKQLIANPYTRKSAAALYQ